MHNIEEYREVQLSALKFTLSEDLVNTTVVSEFGEFTLASINEVAYGIIYMALNTTYIITTKYNLPVFLTKDQLHLVYNDMISVRQELISSYHNKVEQVKLASTKEELISVLK